MLNFMMVVMQRCYLRALDDVRWSFILFLLHYYILQISGEFKIKKKKHFVFFFVHFKGVFPLILLEILTYDF